MKLIKCIFCILAFLIPGIASAQFYITGDDPGKAKWYSIETDNFKLIYPEAADSLARTYIRKIEQFRIPLSLTSGYISGQGDGKKMPVVMHAYNDANGSVAWAPKRMDLFTIPSAYNPEPMPWNTMLSVHESRHITQMQFGMTKAMKPFNLFFGEMWNILASLLYPGISNMEGDAVIAETAWTPSGRGRTADFLNYYWVAFDQSDFRKWHEWRFVSQKHNAPSYYSLGYLTIGGFRYLYDCPQFMSEAYHLSALKPYNLGAFYTTTKKLTGKKYEDAFREVCDTMYSIWNDDAEKRKPYIKSEPVSRENRMYTDYSDILPIGKDIYAIKKGHVDIPTLIRIDSLGKEHKISSFAHKTSRLQWSDYYKRIYWSETKADARWNLKTHSKIRFMEEQSGAKGTLKNPSLLHNPAPVASGSSVAGVKYEMGGRSSVEIISGISGKRIKEYAAPDSLQLVELAWIGNDIYASAVSEWGYGIYRISLSSNLKALGGWEKVLSPQPVMIKDFNSYGKELIFTCDRSGVNELYHLNPSNGELRQKTSLRYGGENFSYSGDGQWLYYSSQTLEGMRIFRTSVNELIDKSVDFTELHKYPIAEAVTAQEKAYADSLDVRTDAEVSISEPERYHKFPHLFNLHSWAPVYVNVDNIMNTRFDQVWEAVSLGLTGILQNRLSTATGEFGYSAHKDPYNSGRWRHSGHLRFKYSGLYPVFELKLDVNDRGARQYSVNAYETSEGKYGIELTSREVPAPYVEGSLSVSIPWRFSSGGWHWGITPRAVYRIGNDMFNSSISMMEYEEHFTITKDGETESSVNPVFKDIIPGKNGFRHSISASLSAYGIQSTANSAVYPRWGIGAELGIYENIESSKLISPMGYAYLYGYMPGIMREQGLRLSVMGQFKLNENSYFSQAVVNILPRGLSSNANLSNWISIRNPFITKLSAEYAVPVYIGELAIGGNLFYIKRLCVKPHFDISLFAGRNLWSVGTELNLDFHSILTLEWPCSIGVTFSCNGGSAFNEIASQSKIKMNQFYIGPTFNVSF